MEELKRITAERINFQSYHTGIEIQQLARTPRARLSSNRTILELKLYITLEEAKAHLASNRTILELK